MKFVSFLIASMFIMSGVIVLLPGNVSAQTVLCNENFNGSNPWTTGNISTTHYYSAPSSYKLATVGGSGPLYNTPVITYAFGANQLNITFEVWMASSAGIGDTALFRLSRAGGVPNSSPIDIRVAANGSLYQNMNTAPWGIYLSGYSITFSTWNTVRIQCDADYNHYKLKINGGVLSPSFAALATYDHTQPDTFTMYHSIAAWYDDMFVSYGAPNPPPVITSSPDTTTYPGDQYNYTMTANQAGGTWAFTSAASWLHLSGNHLYGTAPGNSLTNTSYPVRVTYTNVNGTAYQNFTLINSKANSLPTITTPHFGIVEILAWNNSWNASTEYELITWVGSSGTYQSKVGVYLQDIYATFYPQHLDEVKMYMDMKVYDNDTLIFRQLFPVRTSNTALPAAAYGWLTSNEGSQLNITTQAGHTYYFLLIMNMTDANGTILPSQSFTGVITTGSVTSTQQDWIGVIITLLILFVPVWLMNWWFPRYGFIAGMILMAVLLGVSNVSFLYVSLVIVFTVAVQGYALSKEGK